MSDVPMRADLVEPVIPARRELEPGQAFRGDQIPGKPSIILPYKHAALAAKLTQAAKVAAQRQKDFHAANQFRKLTRHD